MCACFLNPFECIALIDGFMIYYIAQSINYDALQLFGFGGRGNTEMDVNQAVASNLKALRERKKLSLDALSQLTGVSKSMLGQIERSEVNPTISVLWKISGGLKISFSELIEQPSARLEIVRDGDTPVMIEADGQYINHLVFAFDEGRRFEQYRITILPGGVFHAQAHLPGTEEFIIVFEGCAELTVGGATNELGARDSMRFLADVPHSYRNPGDTSTEMSMVIYYPVQ